jgi:LysM repeat protein
MINVEGQDERNSKDQKEADQEAPSYEEIADPDGIDVVTAGPAPSSSGDKNTAEVADEEKDSVKITAPASAEPVNESAAAEDAAAEEKVSENNEKVIYHTVKPNETLFRVAMTYYKSKDGIPIIKKANNIQGNEIQAGQVLKIPIKN